MNEELQPAATEPAMGASAPQTQGVGGITFAALVAQAQADIVTLQAAIATRTTQLGNIQQNEADCQVALDNLSRQLRQRQTFVQAAQIVAGAVTLDSIIP